MSSILSLGDCNTLGINECEGDAYPERLARMLQADVRNRGFTMSTVKEGVNFFCDTHDKQIDIVTIQYGLVDSWRTFKYSPYVLYYPDNPFRKTARKLVKKYKKTCRKLGLNERLGTKAVVPPEEFIAKLKWMIDHCGANARIVLIETVPNQETFRNPGIIEYNQLLGQVSACDPRCRLLKLYDHFLEHMNQLYFDRTHVNSAGHDYIANRLAELLANWDNAT